MKPSPSTIRAVYTLLGLAALALAVGLAQAEEFWKKKAPSQWTSEEAVSLLRKSPWAHQEEVAMTWRRSTAGVQTLVLPPPGRQPLNGPMPRVQSTQRPETILLDSARYLVRWDSALPMRDAFTRLEALGEQTNREFEAPPPRWPEDRYIITVKTLRPPEEGREPFESLSERQLRAQARLKTARGEVEPREVERSGVGAAAAMHFFFPRTFKGQPLLGERPEKIEFRLQRRRIELKSKFLLEPDSVR